MMTVNPVYNYSIEREGAYDKVTYRKTPVRSPLFSISFCL